MGAPPLPPETRTLEALCAQGTVTLSRAGLVADLHIDDDRRQRWVRLPTVKSLKGEPVYRFEGLVYPSVAAAIAKAQEQAARPVARVADLIPSKAPLALVAQTHRRAPGGLASCDASLQLPDAQLTRHERLVTCRACLDAVRCDPSGDRSTES